MTLQLDLQRRIHHMEQFLLILINTMNMKLDMRIYKEVHRTERNTQALEQVVEFNRIQRMASVAGVVVILKKDILLRLMIMGIMMMAQCQSVVKV
jgi:hypothetical protein